ncbi:MAG: hypothetical protein HGB14_04090 [Anaerolineaceae bacterium]|nr:hypothetical protein [Anaerolineaceae bacterium]
MADILEKLPLIVICGASLMLFLNLSWRWNIIALSIQYVGVFWLVLTLWPTGLAAVKLVSGLMSAAVIGSSASEEIINGKTIQFSSKEEIRFKSVLWFVVLLIVLAIIPKITDWLPLTGIIVSASLLLIGIGLLQLGIANEPYRIIFGLLTVLSGFEIIYAGLESSVLVAGVLSIITLGISFIGVFISQIRNEESNP